MSQVRQTVFKLTKRCPERPSCYLHPRLDGPHDVLVSHGRGPGDESQDFELHLRLDGPEFADHRVQRLQSVEARLVRTVLGELTTARLGFLL